ncbi:NAD(P)/FAD-dependent oxidoreductase [Serpentinicella sp. ANB-PHB4]|uniref:NAD(P)/FAD-dependent oxidoreductase n=1 Tax=Serpentinicella sp. ANB-PHB4 TaxID=3074076 RepID=UPI00285E09D4|nr:NAD(P)/FAD-dependent oxidoreductase [Serpentinicella sp. ANB-PHB4]MDR5659961.1 NAD(P)/FAD-dependent oxidoreductase [Serpentinicella sp. ANB-PHB4]
MYDITIIGGGIIGTSVARELSKYKLNVALIEEENDIANGTTKANSAIVHAGYDPNSETLKAKLNVRGNKLFYKICNELDVPFKRIGSLVLAFNQEEMVKINKLYNKGLINGVPNVEIVNRKRLIELEPNVSSNALGGLYAPTTGIVSPWELAIALSENAVENGTQLFLDTEVIDIKKEESNYRVITKYKQFKTKYIINCAGLHADEINNMVNSDSLKIQPNRGQYFLFDKGIENMVNTVVFQCPSEKGKGVVVLPTIHGNLLLGPTSEKAYDKESFRTTVEGLDVLKKEGARVIANLPFDKLITSFSGLRAKSYTGDFIIEESRESNGFINVAGIDSPGLSAAPAIAEHVVEILHKIHEGLEKKEDFNPLRKKEMRFMELSYDEKNEIINNNPQYGRVICRCENITEGEIVDAIHRKVGARTVDGVKKRVRCGMGRCQGGFCGHKVMEIIARELKVDITEVEKDKKGSYILTSSKDANEMYNKINEVVVLMVKSQGENVG